MKAKQTKVIRKNGTIGISLIKGKAGFKEMSKKITGTVSKTIIIIAKIAIFKKRIINLILLDKLSSDPIRMAFNGYVPGVDDATSDKKEEEIKYKEKVVKLKAKRK